MYFLLREYVCLQNLNAVNVKNCVSVLVRIIRYQPGATGTTPEVNGFVALLQTTKIRGVDERGSSHQELTKIPSTPLTPPKGGVDGLGIVNLTGQKYMSQSVDEVGPLVDV